MQALKSASLSVLDPTRLLNATTEEWGLGSLPSNLLLVAASGPQPRTSTAILLSQSNGLLNSTYENISSTLSNNFIRCNNFAKDSNCVLVVDQAWRTTVGPLNSSIISVAYGVVSLVVVIWTAGTMGWLCFRDPSPSPEPPARPHVQHVNPRRPFYRLPPQTAQRDAEPALTEDSLKVEIRHCADLLRQMYALDLEIWGMEFADEPGAQRQKRELQDKADALLREVKRLIYNWNAHSEINWTAEERQCMEEVTSAILSQPDGRYTEHFRGR
jgi:hypothetical protein